MEGKTQKAWLLAKKTLKTISNRGDLCKTYINYIVNENNLQMLDVYAYFLLDELDKAGNMQLIKQYKTKYLYLSSWAIQLSSLQQIMEWLEIEHAKQHLIINNK